MFCHLHVHTQYSLLDGMCLIPQLIARAKEMGMTSLAITDHGVMHGAVEFYLTARNAGVKPVIGSEVYLAAGDHRERETGKSNYHLVLLAKNETGYHNLVQLITRAHLDGFYYKPRVDKELLQQYHEGLIALSACMSGEIPRLILDNRMEDARQAALWYRQTFSDFYLEIQRHPMAELEKLNQSLIAMSRELNIPLVATNDVHYINREDAAAHDLLLCIGTNASVNDEKRMRMPGDYFYLKSPQEMAELYRDIPEAIENTGRIAEMCNLTLEFGRLLLPETGVAGDKTADEFLAGLCRQNLTHYYPNPTPEIRQRLEYELDVIKKTEFANYFLVVWDIISFARQQGILFGVRGSAAASIVLHCLGITEIDPIANKLVFERFLNIERKEMPDIDLDFEDERREEVFSYVSRKYGADHVAQIITFGTLGARAAVRDVGRALGMTYGNVDRIARLIPFGPGVTLAYALKENEELRQIYEQDSGIRGLIDSAMKVEGIARHASTHAAGVVISRDPLTNHIPLQRASKSASESTAMTHYPMDNIARIGLLKMDFLGLINLTVLGKTRQIIRETHGLDIDLQHLPMDDAKTFDLLSKGDTTGVFQLEGTGMRRYIRDLKPTCFSDIAAMVALYRPGPMDNIPTFIKAKQGIEPIRYPHPDLTSILEETYGVIVYQEQVLFIAQAFSGYSLGQADILRKAMGKKIAEVMKKERQNFIAGAEKKGFSTKTAEEVFDLIEPFAGYAFNKAHSVSYAFIAYQTAYLKANYPVEYMTALLTAYGGQSERISIVINECRRVGITVHPPDINRSQINFSIDKDTNGNPAIRFGLSAIKNVGEGAVEPVIAERDRNGEYRSIEDLCQRTDLRSMNRRVLESLIKAGAFDCFGKRGALLDDCGRILGLSQQHQRLRESGQATMFDLWGATVPVPLPDLDLGTDDVPIKQRLDWEKELTGVYLSEHPLSRFKLADNILLCGQVTGEMNGQKVSVVGIVASVRTSFTRKRQEFASVMLEDLDGQVEVTAWPEAYNAIRELLVEGNILQIEGKVKAQEERLHIICDTARIYEPETEETASKPESEVAAPPPPPKTRRLVIQLVQTRDEAGDTAKLERIRNLIKEFPGRDEIKLRVAGKENTFSMKWPGLTFEYCPELHRSLAEFVGEDSISIEE